MTDTTASPPAVPPFQPAGITPTPEQRAIQLARHRHTLVEANAGAAKTTTLALRIAQALARGAQPEMVLALTYTEPAVQALHRQLLQIGVAPALVQRLHISSFDDFCAWLLEPLEGAPVLRLDTLEQLKPQLLRALERAQSYEDERHPEALHPGVPPEALLEGLLQAFALLKGRLLLEQLEPDQRLTPELADELGVDYLTLRVRSAYEFMRRGGHPDRPAFRFTGDATYDLARALLAGELDGEASPLRLGLALIVVDEMHDLNRAMFTVLKALLAANRRAAFVGVGDRDQVIHSQAGAEAGFMHAQFEQEIGVPVRLPLTASYRFGPALAQAAGRLARKPYAGWAGRDTQIAALHAESPRVMARLVAQAAREHLQQQALGELRILLRRPAHSVLIERELLGLGVDYGLQDLQPFLRRRELLLLRGLHAYGQDDFSGLRDPAQRAAVLEALLLFAGAWVDSHELRDLDAVSAQREAIAQAVAHPDGLRHFIEGQVWRNAAPLARRRLQAALDLLKTGSLALFTEALLPALQPLALARAVLVSQDDAQQVQDNLAQLVELARAEGAELPEFFRLLDALDARQARPQRAGRVVLSSIAAAKGLEFDHVLLPYLSRGEFAGSGDATENRNLLYVALTRARQRLTLAYDPARPSRFLADAGLLG